MQCLLCNNFCIFYFNLHFLASYCNAQIILELQVSDCFVSTVKADLSIPHPTRFPKQSYPIHIATPIRDSISFCQFSNRLKQLTLVNPKCKVSQCSTKYHFVSLLSLLQNIKAGCCCDVFGWTLCKTHRWVKTRFRHGCQILGCSCWLTPPS